MYRLQEGEKEKRENREAKPSAHKSLSLPTSAPVSLIHKGYDGWPGQGPGMAFWQEEEKREGRGLICNSRPCFVVYCVSMQPIYQWSSKKQYRPYISLSRAMHHLLCLLSFSLQKEKRQSSSCHVMFKEERGGCRVPPQTTWGHWWPKESLYLSLLHFVKRSLSLCLSLHHRSRLYNNAFINTSSAVCSIPSRWLSEGYRGH